MKIKQLMAGILAAVLFSTAPAAVPAEAARRIKGHGASAEEKPGPGTTGQAKEAGTTGTAAGEAAAGNSGNGTAAESAAAGTAGTGAAQNSGQTEGTLTLIAAGDNLIHKCIDDVSFVPEAGHYDFNAIYDPVRELISSRDLAVINQETIFVSDYGLVSDYPCFGTPTDMGDALVNAGFDVVLSATNHTWDHQERGVLDTLNYWKTAHPEITLLGIHDSPESAAQITYLEKNGIKLALFNYTYGLNGFRVPAAESYLVDLLPNRAKLYNDVRTAEQEADFTVCFLHMGEEYRYTPTADQTGTAAALIDAGADLIVCAHPHVVEPVQQITTAAGNTGLVYYSCGNFLSAQSKLPRLLGGLADVTLQKDASGTHIASWDFIPTVTHFTGREARTYLLSDYTDALAAQNYVNATDGPVTVGRLTALWHNITGR